MREIMYRCWYGNEFVYPDCVGVDEIGPYFIEDALNPDVQYCNCIHEYIGCRDKNMNPIFEGDVIVHINESKYTHEKYHNPIFVIVYKKFGHYNSISWFSLKHICGGKKSDNHGFCLAHYSDQFEVIGNVCENLEFFDWSNI